MGKVSHTLNSISQAAYKHNQLLGQLKLARTILYPVHPTITPLAVLLIKQIEPILEELINEVYTHRLDPDGEIKTIVHAKECHNG